MMKQHKWHKEIKAWADGAEIEESLLCEVNHGEFDWSEWRVTTDPTWETIEYMYRIKPQPKEPDFDATEYQRALKKSAKKFKEKIERTYAEAFDKAINELAEPKEPQYLYVYKDCPIFTSLHFMDKYKENYIGKIKLENDGG